MNNVIEYKLLKKYRNRLNKQQYKTFKGQIKSGDIESFRKGINKVLKIKE